MPEFPMPKPIEQSVLFPKNFMKDLEEFNAEIERLGKLIEQKDALIETQARQIQYLESVEADLRAIINPDGRDRDVT